MERCLEAVKLIASFVAFAVTGMITLLCWFIAKVIFIPIVVGGVVWMVIKESIGDKDEGN